MRIDWNSINWIARTKQIKWKSQWTPLNYSFFSYGACDFTKCHSFFHQTLEQFSFFPSRRNSYLYRIKLSSNIDISSFCEMIHVEKWLGCEGFYTINTNLRQRINSTHEKNRMIFLSSSLRSHTVSVGVRAFDGTEIFNELILMQAKKKN